MGTAIKLISAKQPNLTSKIKLNAHHTASPFFFLLNPPFYLAALKPALKRWRTGRIFVSPKEQIPFSNPVYLAKLQQVLIN